MRRLRYNVAMSLDGFIARRDGSFDWILNDPEIDFSALFSGFDTLVMGRKTFDVLRAQGPGGPADGMKKYVVSRAMQTAQSPDVTLVRDKVAETISTLKASPGKDIWLFGGGELGRLLLDAGLVDTVEVAVIPVLLGDGIPIVTPGGKSHTLRLIDSRSLSSGILMLKYAVDRSHAGRGPQEEGTA